MIPTPKELACSIRAQWRDGEEQPDAQAALVSHPGLAQDRSALVELVYEEFCLRRDRREPVDAREYCARFPELASALWPLLDFDQCIGPRPSRLDGMGPPSGQHWPQVGESFCECTLLRELGKGGFSRVYLAVERPAGDRPVVLKFSSLVNGEARTLGRLHHENIVPIHWARDLDVGWHVVCMPFLGSATLAHVMVHFSRLLRKELPLQGRHLLEAVQQTAHETDPEPDLPLSGPDLERLSFAEAVSRLAERLADALAFLHGRHLYHSDLKPSNVLLTPHGRPVLLDFNLARAGSNTSGQVGGTFPYMAPEHLKAFLVQQPLSDEQAASADLFSLGAVLYELLGGGPPFGELPGKPPKEAVLEMLERQKKGFRPLRELNAQIPGRLARLVESCLAQDPARRPASAAVLARKLRPGGPRRFRGMLAASLALVVVGGALEGTMANSLLSAPPPNSAPGMNAPVRVEEDPKETERRNREEGLAALIAGRKAQEKGNQTEANEHLTKAVQGYSAAIEARTRQGLKRADPEDYINLGRAYLFLGGVSEARNCFIQAEEAHQAGKGDLKYGPSQAYLAYCMARPPFRHPRKAREHGNEARNAKVDTPGVLNNLAYCHIQLADYPTAKSYLDMALKQNPRLRAAYRNRAFQGFQQAYARYRDETVKEKPVAMLSAALADIEEAITLSKNKASDSERAQLYLEAAECYALSCLHEKDLREKENRKQKANQYCRTASTLGADLHQLLANRYYDPVLDKKKLPAPKPSMTLSGGPDRSYFVVDPLPDAQR